MTDSVLLPMPERSILIEIERQTRPTESVLECAERLLIAEALWREDNVQLKAATRLGVTPRVLNYKLGVLGVRPKDTGGRTE